MEIKINFLNEADLEKIDPSVFKEELKKVFDASIPWENPQYDASFQDHYLEQTKSAVFIRNASGEPIALSISFFETLDEKKILYIAGIWVDTRFKSQGMGKVIINTLIDCSVRELDIEDPDNIYITLRTQNAQIYEYFYRQYDLYPHWDKKPTKDIAAVASLVHQRYSPTKVYETENLIIREAYPQGIIVGHVHSPRDKKIGHFIFDKLNVLKGDCYVLVMKYNSKNLLPALNTYSA